MATDDAAVTLPDAAVALNVSPQRISQMLKSGALKGPWVMADRRAPRLAPRVYRASLDEEVARRQLESRPARGLHVQKLEAQLSALKDEMDQLRTGVLDRERAARGAALEMKVAIDVLHDQLLDQIKRNEALAVAAAQLAAAQQRADATEAARSSLSNALSALLSPSGAYDVAGG